MYTAMTKIKAQDCARSKILKPVQALSAYFEKQQQEGEKKITHF
jgi:hypothetical protein